MLESFTPGCRDVGRIWVRFRYFQAKVPGCVFSGFSPLIKEEPNSYVESLALYRPCPPQTLLLADNVL